MVGGLAQKVRGPLRSPIRTESGSDRPEVQREIARILNDTDQDRLNLGPVATALGSDTVIRISLSPVG